MTIEDFLSKRAVLQEKLDAALESHALYCKTMNTEKKEEKRHKAGILSDEIGDIDNKLVELGWPLE